MKKQQIERRERVYRASRRSSRRTLTGSGAALLSAFALACGAKTDNVGESTKWPGVGGAHSWGSAGGRAAGGSVEEMDSGGSHSGSGGSGSGLGGMTASGGMSDGAGGEVQATGGHEAEGGASGGAGGSADSETGGNGGSGGSPNEAVLGEPCSAPGTLSCTNTNVALSLICGADRAWEQSEVCANGDRCFKGDSELAGTCQTPDPECEDRPEKTYCDEEGKLVVCDEEGLFSTKSECVAGCDEDVCISEPPGCPDSEQVFDFKLECSDEGTSDGCFTADAQTVPSGWKDSPIYLRVPAVNDLCRNPSCDRPGYVFFMSPLELYTIEVPQGWGIFRAPGNVDFNALTAEIPCGDEVELHEGCVRTTGGYIYLVPLEKGLGETFVKLETYTSSFIGDKICEHMSTL